MQENSRTTGHNSAWTIDTSKTSYQQRSTNGSTQPKMQQSQQKLQQMERKRHLEDQSLESVLEALGKEEEQQSKGARYGFYESSWSGKSGHYQESSMHDSKRRRVFEDILSKPSSLMNDTAQAIYRDRHQSSSYDYQDNYSSIPRSKNGSNSDCRWEYGASKKPDRSQAITQPSSTGRSITQYFPLVLESKVSSLPENGDSLRRPPAHEVIDLVNDDDWNDLPSNSDHRGYAQDVSSAKQYHHQVDKHVSAAPPLSTHVNLHFPANPSLPDSTRGSGRDTSTNAPQIHLPRPHRTNKEKEAAWSAARNRNDRPLAASSFFPSAVQKTHQQKESEARKWDDQMRLLKAERAQARAKRGTDSSADHGFSGDYALDRRGDSYFESDDVTDDLPWYENKRYPDPQSSYYLDNYNEPDDFTDDIDFVPPPPIVDQKVASPGVKLADFKSLLGESHYKLLTEQSAPATKTGADIFAGTSGNGDQSAMQRQLEEFMRYGAAGNPYASLHRATESFKADSLVDVSADTICARILHINLERMCREDDRSGDGDGSRNKKVLPELPIRFGHEDKYIESFEPLLVEEFKAAFRESLQGDEYGARRQKQQQQDRQQSQQSKDRSKLPVYRYTCSQLQDRVGQVGVLQEALVQRDVSRNSNNSSGDQSNYIHGHKIINTDLQKDELVLIFKQSLEDVTLRSMRDVSRIDHYCLGIVASAPQRSKEGIASSNGNNTSNGCGSSSRSRVQVLLVEKDQAPPTSRTWYILPLMNLCTFLREWQALHSIRDHRLMPLAPYLLKASPVVSQAHLQQMRDTIEKKLRAWVQEYQYEAHRAQQLLQQHATRDPHQVSQQRRLQHQQHQHRLALAQEGIITLPSSNSEKCEDNNPTTKTSIAFSSVQQQLEEVLVQSIMSLDSVRVDSSVLKNTEIVKTLKAVIKADGLPQFIKDVAETLIGRWKAQIIADIAPDTIRNLKGGKVIDIPDKDAITQPRTISDAMWRTLVARYNNSQLFAIKYVVESFDSSQDTRICLVQGPPGTGKTSTIVGMVGALLAKYTTVTPSNNGSSLQQQQQQQKQQAAFTRTISNESGHARLLICAPSNAAVDEILSRLSQGVVDQQGNRRELRIVRLGDPLEGSSSLIRALSLVSQVEAALQDDPLLVERANLESQLRDCERMIRQQQQSGLSLDKKPTVDTASGKAPKKSDLQQLQEHAKRLRAQLVWNDMGIESRRGELRLSLLYAADVVGGTLSSSGKQHFLDYIVKENVLFHTTIIDEAAQTTEPASLIPLRFGCRRLVLVGDPRQLPATVLSRAADRALLGRSLFERLEQAEHEVVMLTVQYRMHPEIRRFPSQYFYQDLLIDAPGIVAETSRALTYKAASAVTISKVATAVVEVEDGEVHDGHDSPTVASCSTFTAEEEMTWHVSTRLITDQSAGTSTVTSFSATTTKSNKTPRLAPVMFMHVGAQRRGDRGDGGGERQTGKSYVNEHEARALVQWLCQLDRDIVEAEQLTFAVVTPYKAQVHLIRQQLEQTAQLSYLLGSKANEGNKDGEEGATVDVRIEVNTVDGFQGREKDVVLFSAVRSQAHHEEQHRSKHQRNQHHRPASVIAAIGFVADERRINVAITRAKKMLVIFGNVYTLSLDSIWNAMIEDLDARGCVHR